MSSSNRKYKLALIFATLLLAAFIFTGFNPLVEKTFSEIVYGIVGIYLTYCGGNVVASGVFHKFANKTETTQQETIEKK